MSIPDILQSLYERHRTPKTWGTPTISPFFFDRWRDKGLFQALGYLVERERELGNPHIHPTIKAGMNLGGCVMLVLGIETTQSPLKILKSVMYALLFSAQGEGGIPKEVTRSEILMVTGGPDASCPRRRGQPHVIVFNLQYMADECVECGALFYEKKSGEDGPRWNVPDEKPCGCAWNESCLICREED
jgi:hypothetical protein